MAYSCNPPEPPEPQARVCGAAPLPLARGVPDDGQVRAREEPGVAGQIVPGVALAAPGGQSACLAPEAPLPLVCWLNEAQVFVAQCGAGRTGPEVSRSFEAGKIGSNLSQADANARALAVARAAAEAALVCEWWNEAQSYTARCGQNTSGNSLTVTTPAGVLHRPLLADANAEALRLAREQAEAELVCLYLNDTQVYTAVCPEGTLGPAVVVSKGPSEQFMAATKAEANALALAAAQIEAEALLLCWPDWMHGDWQSFAVPSRTTTVAFGMDEWDSFSVPSRTDSASFDLANWQGFASPSGGATQTFSLDGWDSFLSPTLGASAYVPIADWDSFLIES